MALNRGTFWKRTTGGRDGKYVWVRFIFQIEDEKKAHYLEYIPNGKFPHRNYESVESWEEYWEPIGGEEAAVLVENMAEQDEKYAFRMGKQKETEKLAEALKILKNKKIGGISVCDGAIRFDMENGSSYEISIVRDGYESRQTGLPDPC